MIDNYHELPPPPHENGIFTARIRRMGKVIISVCQFTPHGGAYLGWGYLPCPGGTYLGWGRGTYLSQGRYLSLLGGTYLGWGSIGSPCYVTGGMPLAFTQEDCLFVICSWKNSSWHFSHCNLLLYVSYWRWYPEHIIDRCLQCSELTKSTDSNEWFLVSAKFSTFSENIQSLCTISMLQSIMTQSTIQKDN